MKDDNCIFCKLASGEIPSVTIYEDADFRVILDLSPASKGHALIIPKEHYRNLYDLDDELAAKALVLAKKMICKMKDILGCDGYNIVQNNEEPAGPVSYTHLWSIPCGKCREELRRVNAMSILECGAGFRSIVNLR